MKQLAVCFCLVFSFVFIKGCSPIEVQAYRTIVGAKAFLDSEKQSHPSCATGSTADPCPYLARATSAKDFLIDAAEVYCSGPDFESGGKCNPPTNTALKEIALAKLQAAIRQYDQAEKDLKGVLK